MMFAYRAGGRLTIVLSRLPLPEGTRARELRGNENAWTVRSGGLTIICAQGSHAMLLLGTGAAWCARQARS
jgi:hypothetical protein